MSLRDQITKYNFCPYCNSELGSDAELDHIYPVKKGGQSTKGNLVYVCPPCNKNKGAKTLMTFLNENGSDVEKVFNILKKLGKEF